MSIDLYSKLNWNDIRHLIIFHCAPLLSGLKISNLLVINEEGYKQACNFLGGSGIEIYVLSRKDGKIVLFLFNRSKVLEYLFLEHNLNFLKKLGYNDIDVDKILYQLSIKYNGYQNGECSFPHELGIMLGYPLVDVYGFMVNDGEGYIFNGYWKVYGQADKAKETFKAYDEATSNMVLKFVSVGNVDRVSMLGIC
ncbi:MAG: DUF3793 family protein [Butyrivibrio sp.]|nr:DUF3793 family protein [Butyrivibrio sp.]